MNAILQTNTTISKLFPLDSQKNNSGTLKHIFHNTAQFLAHLPPYMPIFRNLGFYNML